MRCPRVLIRTRRYPDIGNNWKAPARALEGPCASTENTRAEKYLQTHQALTRMEKAFLMLTGLYDQCEWIFQSLGPK